MSAEPAESPPKAPAKFSELLNMEDAALRDAPAYFELLRQEGPVVWVDDLGSFAVTGYDEAVEVLMDTDRFSSQLGDPKGPLINSRLAEVQSSLAARSQEFHDLVAGLEPDWRHPPCLLTADPPLHTRQRQVVNRLFTPRRVEGMEPGSASSLTSWSSRSSSAAVRSWSRSSPYRSRSR